MCSAAVVFGELGSSWVRVVQSFYVASRACYRVERKMSKWFPVWVRLSETGLHNVPLVV